MNQLEADSESVDQIEFCTSIAAMDKQFVQLANLAINQVLILNFRIRVISYKLWWNFVDQILGHYNVQYFEVGGVAVIYTQYHWRNHCHSLGT